MNEWEIDPEAGRILTDMARGVGDQGIWKKYKSIEQTNEMSGGRKNSWKKKSDWISQNDNLTRTKIAMMMVHLGVWCMVTISIEQDLVPTSPSHIATVHYHGWR